MELCLHPIETCRGEVERLVGGGFARLGRMEAVGEAQPRRPAPTRHNEEPIDDVRERVDRVCREAKTWSGWAFCCWLVKHREGVT